MSELAGLYADVTIPPPVSARPEFFERLPRALQDSEGRLRWAIRFWGPTRYQESVKGYYRLVTGIDRVVGRIRAALAERGLADTTAIVYSGDNGFFLGEYGLAGKWTPHEASIRVPLLVYDLRRDPQELENLAGRREWNPVMDEMRASWARWREQAR